MKSQSALVYLVVLSMLIACMSGCAKKPDASPDEPETGPESSNEVTATATEDTIQETNAVAGPETSLDFNHVLSAWDAGNKQETSERFIQIDWDKAQVFANVPLLNIPEQDLAESSEDRQRQIVKELNEFTAKLHELGLHILSVGDTSLAAGQRQAAQTHYEALLKWAQSLASKDGAGVHRVEARGFVKAVEDRLSALELGQDYHRQSQKQVDEVRAAFLSLQRLCKANDVEGYLDFWDYETRKAVDGRDLDIDQRRERRRQSLTKRPQTLQQIAGAKIESITVDYWKVESLQLLLGVEIEGTMMRVRTNGLDLWFHETAKAWKLFNVQNVPR
ncbi:MAG: hypothetical protein ACYTEL_16715 [Planctomycetota bacterium]|jgi:hypothetical protein